MARRGWTGRVRAKRIAEREARRDLSDFVDVVFPRPPDHREHTEMFHALLNHVMIPDHILNMPLTRQTATQARRSR